MRNIGWMRCELQVQITNIQIITNVRSLLTGIKPVISDLLRASKPDTFVMYW
jgi:hypothetical protein